MLMTHIPNLICVMGYSLGDICQRKMAQVTWNTSFATLLDYYVDRVPWRRGAAWSGTATKVVTGPLPRLASPSLTDAFSG